MLSRPRVLFLPGQGSNARLARILLAVRSIAARFRSARRTYEMPAFTNEQQPEQVGLSGLVAPLRQVGGLPRVARRLRALYPRHHQGATIVVTDVDRSRRRQTLAYVRQLAETYEPFGGLVGFWRAVPADAA